jgi:hypothetical protein
LIDRVTDDPVHIILTSFKPRLEPDWTALLLWVVATKYVGTGYPSTVNISLQ